MAAKFFVALQEINDTSVVVGFGIIRFQSDCLVIVLDGQLILTEVIISKPPVIISIGIIRFQAYGLIIVFKCQLVLAEFSVSISSVVIGIGIIRTYTDCRIAMINSLIDFIFFSQRGCIRISSLLRSVSWFAGSSPERKSRSRLPATGKSLVMMSAS